MKKVLLYTLLIAAFSWAGYQVYEVSDIISAGIYYEPPGIRIDIGRLFQSRSKKSLTVSTSGITYKFQRDSNEYYPCENYLNWINRDKK